MRECVSFCLERSKENSGDGSRWRVKNLTLSADFSLRFKAVARNPIFDILEIFFLLVTTRTFNFVLVYLQH